MLKRILGLWIYYPIACVALWILCLAATCDKFYLELPH